MDLRFVDFSTQELIEEIIRRSDAIVICRNWHDSEGHQMKDYVRIPVGTTITDLFILAGRASTACSRGYSGVPFPPEKESEEEPNP